MQNLSPLVLLERVGPVAIITLNRPDQRNSVNTGLADALRKAIVEFETSPELRIAVLTGAGAVFCAGMDLGAFLDGEGDSILFGENLFAGFVNAKRSKPVIAAIEGAAVAGGLELALACDMIVSGKSAKFGLPEVQVGLFPVAGGAFRLAQVIPPAKALEMCLTGDSITATEAQNLGLINHLVPDGEAFSKAIELAGKIASNAPLAVQALYQVSKFAKSNEQEAWAASRHWWHCIKDSEDAQEGPAAFKEKRSPQWTGK
ncbi:crotonase/enoyl-CoA hydratase family protein [Leisingera sp. JC1]|uniref:crotonase/enoyl-CoA hydratase family protein n=1 Tax=Leisingera sp. JC1 TaxID=1855282 RepID=UPI000803BE93|nr:crotonase/enoyl-CoA hydratase family protein [Leisingera sp. JC1]OBY25315.1 hypothetical protein A9D60_05930 [Leisingera sp. JC1]